MPVSAQAIDVDIDGVGESAESCKFGE